MTISLADRIRDRSCCYGVIGLGYVGLPLALAFAKQGLQVIGYDVDEGKVADANAGRSYIPDVDSEELGAQVRDGRLKATTDAALLAEADVISICVPTPLSKSRDPDLSYVESALRSVEKILRPGQLIVLESTTYPGMTVEYLLPRLQSGGLVAGRDFWLAFSPERVDPGNRHYGIHNTPKVVGGVESASTEMAANFYRIAIPHVHPVSSASAAETVKLLENTFRSVNIGLVNEVALMCDRLGLDVSEIIEAAATKPFGFMPFQPGPGIGGHCIPLDPIYLSWKLRTLDYRARFVELAQDVNTGMPRYLAERVTAALNDREKSVKGSKILVLGVAYKKDVGDTRESPALEVMRLLLDNGADLSYSDPHVETITLADRLFTSVPLSQELLADTDCVVVTTDHTDFAWEDVATYAALIVDARGAVPKDKVRGTLVPLSGPSRGNPGAGVPDAQPSRARTEP